MLSLKISIPYKLDSAIIEFLSKSILSFLNLLFNIEIFLDKISTRKLPSPHAGSKKRDSKFKVSFFTKFNIESTSLFCVKTCHNL